LPPAAEQFLLRLDRGVELIRQPALIHSTRKQVPEPVG